MGLQHYTQDMSKLTLKYNINVLFYTKYTHPMLICRGTDARTHGRTDARTDGRTDGRTENIYSTFRDKLLLLGEHGYEPSSRVGITITVNGSYRMLMDSLSMCSNSLYMSKMDGGSSLKGLSASTMP